ncbi:GFA family protein [Sphingomonas cavernae]|uniref:GFA family protein n=1 Tax=Sphingomonas cavernae TaxID=2320861 RepID=A0A418WS12_9SPHN|nr:GFA family protein [Sphingomonas cavernae]RJF93959.1 GFA family protein [Sphingomonas cavernae]
MSVQGSCHCGRVRFSVPEMPREVKSCGCSICRKLGNLTAYCHPDDFKLAPESEAALSRYSHGDRMIALCFCATCGCSTHWHALPERFADCFPEGEAPRLGFNARLLDGFDAGAVQVIVTGGREG